jgi:amidase
MDVETYAGLDATALAAAVRSNQVTPSELRDAAAAQHEATAKDINAVVEWYPDPDPVTAPQGPLAGVPFLRKDYGSAEAGRLVEMGSRLAAGHRAGGTDEYFRRLKAAGAQVLGRTAVPELIQHGSTESRVFGATRNPHDLALSAGGSSGGAGAAVAAGVVPAAHASDCAGSIRIPAAVCGLVGLKPARRAVPWSTGGWGGIAEEFVLTRSLRDAALFWSVLAEGLQQAFPSAVRIGISTDHWAGAADDPAVVAAAVEVGRRLESLGHRVDAIAPPLDDDELMSTWHPLFSRWVAHDVMTLAARTGRGPGPETLEPLTLNVLEAVARLSVDDVTNAQVAQGGISRRLEQAMSGLDVLVTPTLGRPTIGLGVLAGEVTSMDDYLRRNSESFPFSFLFNVTGWAALSVPAGTTEAGHPIGVQLAARPGRELALLRLAGELA